MYLPQAAKVLFLEILLRCCEHPNRCQFPPMWHEVPQKECPNQTMTGLYLGYAGLAENPVAVHFMRCQVMVSETMGEP